MNLVALVSHLAGAALFLALSVLLGFGWRGRAEGGLLLLAATIQTAWLGTLAYQAVDPSLPDTVPQAMEILRDSAWFLFFLRLLGYSGPRRSVLPANIRRLSTGIYSFLAILLGLVLLHPIISTQIGRIGSGNVTLLGFVLLSVVGLVLVEQLFRNTHPDYRWQIKFLCFGVGGMLAYDFYYYSDAVLFTRTDPALWAARGGVNALVAPLIAVAAKRNRDWSVEVFASKTIVFHSATFLGAGLYLLTMAGAGYYVRQFGGGWGPTVQTVFLFGAVILLAVLLFSGQVRAHLKLFLNKHFFGYKYDYRAEWLRFINTLSANGQGTDVRQSAIRAIADIVESPGGILWTPDGSGAFAPVARLSMPEPKGAREPVGGSLVRFLEQQEWIIDLSEYDREPELYSSLELPGWLGDLPNAWLVVPLMLDQRLAGFVVLARSRGNFTFNWEDTDLLKMVGRQAGSYLALLNVTQALADARQFEAFNRLSAYVVHDLKNMVAQLSLVVSNAKKYLHNPEFAKDAIHTVENTVARMNRLLEQLRKDRIRGVDVRVVDLKEVVDEVVKTRSVARPCPVLERAEEGLCILANRDRLTAVVGHLVQNAQEATSAEGTVSLSLVRDGGQAVVVVEDNGIGMDSEFIRERLFRPFDTTKGNAGMGVGAYEVREFARAQGGEVEVDSEPGRGTRFRLALALAQEADSVPKVSMAQ